MSSDQTHESSPSDALMSVPPGVDPDILERVVSVEAVTVNLGGMLHEAATESADGSLTFTFRSDEPPGMTGEDQHPYPLHYFTGAIGL